MNRGLEIAADAADAAQSLVLDQVSAGVAVRMSVLYHLLAGDDSADAARQCTARPLLDRSGRRRCVGRAEPRRTCYVDDGVIAEVGSMRPPRTPSVIDADGLVALPGLVDLHTHLREPGREDAETIATGSRGRGASAASPPCSRWPTPPRSPTPPRRPSGSLDLGRARRPGRRPAGRRGHQGPGRRGARRARADGPLARAGCGSSPTTATASHDARVMRRALEYVRAFGGVVSQHAQDPRLAGPRRLLPRGRALRPARPARLAAASPRRSIVARDVMLARHTGSRVHVAPRLHRRHRSR